MIDDKSDSRDAAQKAPADEAQKNSATSKLSTESYKGVRDFYPEEMFVQNYIFGVWRKAVEKFGYQEYGASVLEPTELYRAKSGEEIVKEQTYSFRDRGDRDVTLRPEMTPTVARMVAARKRELGFPLRWYSIPNLFRYEQPQRGRLREHWQLNVDLFGSDSINADAEVIQLAYSIMKSFGAKDEDFEIRINDRKGKDQQQLRWMKLLDKKEKMSKEEFTIKQKEVWNDAVPPKFVETEDVKKVLERLADLGIVNARFDKSLARGFDYYTGVVFEVFDTNSANRRSLFGGGRYDDLTSLFGGDKVHAVGFGMGDVTIRDFLETHDQLPRYASSAQLYLCSLDEKQAAFCASLADALRKKGLTVALDFTDRKVGDKIKTATKQSVPYILIVGEDEVKSGLFKVKELASGKETSLSESQIADMIGKKPL